ncbi:hypothetical protein AB3N04_00795 (plasmid) [Alkalihalophilus sp. As8PL]|uniref:Uncharacterized protein n=1 Tax=Alkalihalophilus sp. As8PL TaxID=3237103 RepID=A0AB39BMI4_9BACI
MNSTLTQKIEWLLDGGLLVNKGNNKVAAGFDPRKGVFYTISGSAILEKEPTRIFEEERLPLKIIDKELEKLYVS